MNLTHSHSFSSWRRKKSGDFAGLCLSIYAGYEYGECLDAREAGQRGRSCHRGLSLAEGKRRDLEGLVARRNEAWL